MSSKQYRNRRKLLWRNAGTRVSILQVTQCDSKEEHDDSKAIELSPDTVVVHVPGSSETRGSSTGTGDGARFVPSASRPDLSLISKSCRDDLVDGRQTRPSSDDDESCDWSSKTSGVGQQKSPNPAGESAWLSGHYSRSGPNGPVCTTPGMCQAGGELRLIHLSDKTVQVPEGFELVGAKSPRMPGMTLVAAVDRRFLPDERNNVTMLGFSGNCVGCGAKGFRYFTEFSCHINLKLGTQPKKQKHLKYYIVKEADGTFSKGSVIPWRVEAGRKRTFPHCGPHNPPAYSLSDTEQTSETLPANSAQTPLLSTSDCMPSETQSASKFPSDSDVKPFRSFNRTVEVSYQNLPPVKRRRLESDDSVPPTAADEQHNNDAPTLTSPAFDAKDLPSEPWLSAACNVRPVLLLCHRAIPQIPCNLDDVIISDLLVGCFDPPLVSDHHNQCGVYSKSQHASTTASNESPYSSVPCLTTQMAVLLTVQYLAQFVDDDRICREDVESLLQDARLELTASVQHQGNLLAQSNAVTHVQLPVLACLAAATSKGRVKVVSSPVSLENAIVRALKFILEIYRHNQIKFPKVPVPDFIFILATSQKKSPEFCVFVTSVSQSKYLTEAMIGHPVRSRISDNLASLEQLFRLSSDALEQLIASYEAMSQGQLVFFPFNGFARMKVVPDEASRLEPRTVNTTHQHQDHSTQTLFASQHLMAKQILSQVCTMGENSSAFDLNSFRSVEFTIVVPPILTLYNQTVGRLWKSRLVTDLELDAGAASLDSAQNFVIKHDGKDETREQLLKLLENVQKNSKVLFVLILDQVQFYASPCGAVDLPYYRELQDAHNVLMLFVTATPYLLQTNCSFIKPENEVYWSDIRSEIDGGSSVSSEDRHDSATENSEGTYFGMKEYCESIKWTHQFPLVRQDDAFEKMAFRTSRTTEDVSLSVLRCYLLVRHYCAAIMWSAGIKPAEPHCTLKTVQIMREVIESPVHNGDGSGAMLVIRIPSVELANVAFESLKNTRDRLGFQFRFAIIHDSGSSELEIEEYFLRRLRIWREQRGHIQGNKSCANWSPKCFEDLHDLPCIIIMSGRERPGETFPRSLKYIDLRLIDRGFVYRSTVELEFSAIARYIGAGTGSRTVEGSDSNGQQVVNNKDETNANVSSGTTCKTSHYSSNYPLPVILVSRSVFRAFQSDFYGYPKHLLLPTASQTRWCGLGRPPVVTSNPRHQSLYYREWTEPKPKQFCGQQVNPAHSQSTVTVRSASGIVVGPDITDVIEDDGLSAVESLAGSYRVTSGADTSDSEDSTTEDNRQNSIDGAAGNRSRDQEVKAVKNGSRCQSVVDPSTMEEGRGFEGSKPRPSDRYHPRSVLFSGPPQVGKTLAYLQFVRLLHRTVQKLQCVEVYNENVDCLSLTKCERPVKDEDASLLWPVHDSVSQLPFHCTLTEYRLTNASKLRVHNSTGHCTNNEDVSNGFTHAQRPAERPSSSLMLSPLVAYDFYHHCDTCKHYREGLGSSASPYYVYTLQSGEKLQFVIPAVSEQFFTFSEEKRLRSLRLPLVLTGRSGESVRLLKRETGEQEVGKARAVKSPIMVPSCGRHESGLLNLYHAMEGENHVLLVFVKNQEVVLYHKAWPNHVIVGLPQSYDLQGLGAARYFIKQFATENWLTERERLGVSNKHGQPDVWPFIFMMDDSCVLWQNLLKQNMKKEATSGEELDSSFSGNTSLLKIIQLLECTPDLMNYGMVGVRQYSTKCSDSVAKGSFSHCPLNTAIMLNLRLLQDVPYDKQRFTHEDLDFSLRVFAIGIHACRFNHLVVAKKVIEAGGNTCFKILATGSSKDIGEGKKVEPGERLVTAPDREDAPYLPVPAHYLLEQYMAQMGADKLFPEAADKPDLLVLVVNRYVNLGPRIRVEFVSTSTEKTKGKEAPRRQGNNQATRYGGLLLYLCDHSVSADFLAQFKFVPGSRLCLVCQDRNTLRQEVVRLDLEENWRFRLRDEFQTANCPDEPALYFLTGTYV